MERTPNKAAHKVKSGEENSPAAPAGIRTRNLSTTSPAVYEGRLTAPKHIPKEDATQWRHRPLIFNLSFQAHWATQVSYHRHFRSLLLFPLIYVWRPANAINLFAG